MRENPLPKTCLFCSLPEKSYQPAKSVDFICGSCVQLLLSADQGELTRAYEKAVRLGYTRKASAIETFLVEVRYVGNENEQRESAINRGDYAGVRVGGSSRSAGVNRETATVRGEIPYVQIGRGRPIYLAKSIISWLKRKEVRDTDNGMAKDNGEYF